MKHLIVALVLLTASWAQAQSRGNVRYVYKGVRPSFPDARRMTFGLSVEQARRIGELTNGRVRLDEYYFVDRPRDLRLPLNEPGFSGVIQPDVPPPVVVSDPELANQWWIERLNVPQAWELATGAGVTIADCDSGFHYDEPDLFPNMRIDLRYDLGNPAEPDVVNDGGFVFHGTAVAAIMGSVLNGAGTNGIAFNSKIVPLQNYNYDGRDTLDKEEATAKCVLHAIATPGVSIIVLENQMANGSSEAFAGTRDAVRLALQSGLIVVGAGGNNSVPLAEEEKDDTGSIIVGALTMNEEAAGFSNFGGRATVGAFGEQLYTLYGPNGRFGSFGGTSGATPQVAATVALMKEVNPWLTPEQARDILVRTRRITDGNRRVGGLLDSAAAVKMTKELPADVTAWSTSWLFRQQLAEILVN